MTNKDKDLKLGIALKKNLKKRKKIKKENKKNDSSFR